MLDTFLPHPVFSSIYSGILAELLSRYVIEITVRSQIVCLFRVSWAFKRIIQISYPTVMCLFVSAPACAHSCKNRYIV